MQTRSKSKPTNLLRQQTRSGSFRRRSVSVQPRAVLKTRQWRMKLAVIVPTRIKRHAERVEAPSHVAPVATSLADMSMTAGRSERTRRTSARLRGIGPAQTEPHEASSSSHEPAAAVPEPTVDVTLLQRRERTLERKEGKLKGREEAVRAKEEALKTQLALFNERKAGSSLELLQSLFTCPLCYDIIAHPFSLANQQCGHTYCATCCLKWFLSYMHDECGGWHEIEIECPLCRAEVYFAECSSEVHICPFIPNRMVDGAIEKLIDMIEEDLEQHAVHDRGRDTGRGKRKGKGKEKRTDPEPSQSGDNVSAWRRNGATRIEWNTRRSNGIAWMGMVVSQWGSLNSGNWKDIKKSIQDL